jgi:hypothetical protein
MKLPDNAHSVIHNYVIAGLDSYLIGDGSSRLFHMTRNQVDYVTPHSHKFDLKCEVLHGEVTNTIFTEWDEGYEGDAFLKSEILYLGEAGSYTKAPIGEVKIFTLESKTYRAGDVYHLKHDQIHSIQFAKGAMVKITEGVKLDDYTTILEPFSHKRIVKNFKVHDGLFIKGK